MFSIWSRWMRRGEVGLVFLNTNLDTRNLAGGTMRDRRGGGCAWEFGGFKTTMMQWHRNTNWEPKTNEILEIKHIADYHGIGTLDDPIMVKSFGDEQFAGCTGYPVDSHVVIWLGVCLVFLPPPFTPSHPQFQQPQPTYLFLTNNNENTDVPRTARNAMSRMRRRI